MQVDQVGHITARTMKSRIVGHDEVAPDQLLANPHNWRRHPKHQMQALEGVLDEVGWVQRVIVNQRTGHVVDGHLRVQIALARNEPTVPVVYVDLSDAEERLVLATLDPIAALAETDQQMLDEIIRDLTTDNQALNDLLDDLRSEAISLDGEADDDEIPEPAARPVSRLGDVWAMGDHLLVCGDATTAEAYASLFQDGERAHLLFTSPPYANQRDYTTGGIKDWDALMQGVFGAAQTALREDAQVLVNLGLVHRDGEWQPYWDGWIAWMRTQGFRRFGWYVWDQGYGLPGDWGGRFAPSFEFIFHFNRRGRKPNKIVHCDNAGRKKSNTTILRNKDGSMCRWSHIGRPIQETRIPDSVIRITRQAGSIGHGIDHPAVFSVALPQFILEAYTDAGEIVLEPFAGSGTTILAGELTGRRVRAIELAPEYVDVALHRWMQHHPELVPVLRTSGQTYHEVEVARAKDE